MSYIIVSLHALYMNTGCMDVEIDAHVQQQYYDHSEACLCYGSYSDTYK